MQRVMEGRFGLRAGVGIHNSWLTFYLRNHREAEAQGLLARMRASGPRPNSTSFRVLARHCAGAGDWAGVAGVRREMAAQGVAPDARFYEALQQQLVRQGQLAGAERLLGEMRGAGVAPRRATYTALLGGWAAAGEEGRVAALLGEMRGAGVAPDIVQSNRLLAVYAERRGTEGARAQLQEMAARGLRLNAFTYAALLHGLVQQRRLVEACELIHSMDRGGISLPASAYARLVDACCRAGFLPGVHFLRQQMRQHGVQPGLPLFTAQLRLALRRRRYDSAAGLLAELAGAGLRWNAVVYGVLLGHFVEALDVGRVAALLARMRAEHVPPTPAIHDALMRAFYVHCRYAQGGYLFRVLPRGPCTLAALARAHADAQAPALAQTQRLDLAQLRAAFEGCFGLPFRLSAHIFNDLMLTFLRLARFDDFFACHAEMLRARCPPTPLTFTLLIKARLYLGQAEAARALLPEMARHRLRPSLLQAALVFHALCRALATPAAEALLADLPARHRLLPNHVFYASLLYAYLRRRDFPRVFATFARLEHAGFTPDTETCNYVLMALYEVGEHAEAARFFDKMCRQGIRRNTHSYYILADRLVLQGDADRFLERVADCALPGNAIDALPFNRLLAAYYRAGQFDVVRRVLLRMLALVVRFDDGTLPYLAFLCAEALRERAWALLDDLLRKALVDFDPDNFQVAALVDAFRDALVRAGETTRLSSFLAYLDHVDDLRRLWVLPSPLLAPERDAFETARSAKGLDLSVLELDNLLHDFAGGKAG